MRAGRLGRVGWRRWLAAMAGGDGWRRWLAAMPLGAGGGSCSRHPRLYSAPHELSEPLRRSALTRPESPCGVLDNDFRVDLVEDINLNLVFEQPQCRSRRSSLKVAPSGRCDGAVGKGHLSAPPAGGARINLPSPGSTRAPQGCPVGS